MKRLVVEDIGPHPIKFLRMLRRVTGVGLKEAAAIRDSLPGLLLDGVPDAQAEALISQFVALECRARCESTEVMGTMLRLPRVLSV